MIFTINSISKCKEDTLITIQIDMLLAEKFGMYYTDADGQKKLPYIIHRTSLGCYERTLAYLIEKYAGALPTWMSPEQVRILTITDRANEYAAEIAERLSSQKYRVTIDDSQNTLKYKIRNAQLEKVPYMLVIGAKEIEENTVSIRSRESAENETMKVDEFVDKIKEEVENKTK